MLEAGFRVKAYRTEEIFDDELPDAAALDNSVSMFQELPQLSRGRGSTSGRANVYRSLSIEFAGLEISPLDIQRSED